MITKEKLAELRKLSAEATPGPWIYDDGAVIFNAPENVDGDENWSWQSYPCQYWQGFDDDDQNKFDSDNDEVFIATLRNNIDALLDLIELQQRVIDKAEELVNIGRGDTWADNYDAAESHTLRLLEALKAYREKKE